MLCFRCGVCCTKYQPRMNLPEVMRLASFLGIVWEEFVEKYTDRRWPGTESFLVRQEGGACIFLQKVRGRPEVRCTIHLFRPASCREWTPGLAKQECRKGLNDFWGLTAGPTWRLEGPKEKQKEFELFLQSIMGLKNEDEEEDQ